MLIKTNIINLKNGNLPPKNLTKRQKLKGKIWAIKKTNANFF